MIGKLRHRIELRKKVKAPDGRGGYLEDEVLVGKYWAAFHSLGSYEIEKFKALFGEVDTSITMRYTGEFSHLDHVIYFRDRKYELRGIINPGYKNRYYEIAARTVEKVG